MLFRRTDRYGYSRYNSNGGPIYILKIVVSIALAIALVIGGTTFTMKQFTVYTESGGHLQLPWSKTDGTELSADASPLTVEDSAKDDKTDAKSDKAEDAKTDNKTDEQPTDAKSDAEKTDTNTDEQTGEQGGLFGWFANLFGGNKQADADASSSTAASSSSAEGSSDQSAEPEQPAKALPDGMRVQHVTIRSTRKGEAKYDVDANDGNGVMVYMKESGGTLNFVSSHDVATSLEVNTDEDVSGAVKSAIQDLKGEGYYTVALVDCFQDEQAGNSEYKLYDDGGSTWYDGDGRAWANPASRTYQKYLVSIISDLADVGYDEIVLKNACYPLTGDTDILSPECYNSDDFRTNINKFYSRIAEKMQGRDTIVSVIATEKSILKGKDKTSGQTLENMKQLGGRLWVENPENTDELLQALKDAGYPDNALGLLVSSFDSDNDICQMNVD